jgi:hypothetical protein
MLWPLVSAVGLLALLLGVLLLLTVCLGDMRGLLRLSERLVPVIGVEVVQSKLLLRCDLLG